MINIKQLAVASLLFATAGIALADQAYPPETPFVSTKTRAEVIAELQQAQAQGLVTNADDYPVIQTAQPSSVNTQPSQGEFINQHHAAIKSLYQGA